MTRNVQKVDFWTLLDKSGYSGAPNHRNPNPFCTFSSTIIIVNPDQWQQNPDIRSCSGAHIWLWTDPPAFLDISGHFWTLQTSLGAPEIKNFVCSPKESKSSIKMLSYEKKSFGIGSVVAENEQKTCESPESEPPPAGPHSPGGSQEPNMTYQDDL